MTVDVQRIEEGSVLRFKFSGGLRISGWPGYILFSPRAGVRKMERGLELIGPVGADFVTSALSTFADLEVSVGVWRKPQLVLNKPLGRDWTCGEIERAQVFVDGFLSTHGSRGKLDIDRR